MNAIGTTSPIRPAGWIAALLLLCSCSSVRSINDQAILAESDATAEASIPDPISWIPPAQTEYRIGPRDVLEIDVYELEEPDNSKLVKVRVSQSGNIALPLIGSITASGKTAAELQSDIESALGADFLVNPSVNLLVTEYQARSVTILGAVQSPGTFRLQQNSTTLVGALAIAGGVTDKAGSEVFVVRARAGSKPAPTTGQPSEASTKPNSGPKTTAAEPRRRVLKISLIDLVERGDLSANCALADGDVVHVPPVSHFFVSGLVEKGGRFPLRGEITVLRAVAMAGGLKDEATPTETILIRKTPQGRITIPIDLTELEAGSDKDIRLLPDDVVQANESAGSKFVRGFTSIFRGLFHVGYALD